MQDKTENREEKTKRRETEEKRRDGRDWRDGRQEKIPADIQVNRSKSEPFVLFLTFQYKYL